MTTNDKHLVDALIAAQTDQGYQASLIADGLSDATTVGGISWADLKTEAMHADYKSSNDYETLSDSDQDLID